MQQFGTAIKAATHSLAVGKRHRGQRARAKPLDRHVPDSLVNRELPHISQHCSDGPDGLSSFVEMSVLDIAAFMNAAKTMQRYSMSIKTVSHSRRGLREMRP